MKMNIVKLLLILYIIFVTCFGSQASEVIDEKDQSKTIYLHAKVLSIENDVTDENNFMRTQTLKVEITDKNYATQIEAENLINIASIHNVLVKPNDEVIVLANKTLDNKLKDVKLYSYARDKYLLILLGIFMTLIILFGRKNGLSAIVSLAITIIMIFFVFFPIILNGIPPVLGAAIICVVSTFITLIFIGNFNSKTYAAITGTLGGLLASGILTHLFGFLTHIQGIEDENVQQLSYLTQGRSFNFKELLFAGIIIGALGAVMDVSVSISSSMDEIHKANPRLNNFDLFKAGMRIGKDIMGTMTNTLILAYVGSSINLILVFFVYQLSFTQFINSDLIASEILRGLCGSTGLVLSIPITTLAYLLFNNKPNKYFKKV